MTPLPDHHEISREIRVIVEPDAASTAISEIPKEIILINDPAKILAVIEHVRRRSEEIGSLIGESPL